MEVLLKEFVNYLFDIVYKDQLIFLNQGIIGIRSIKSFLSLYDKYTSQKDTKQKQKNKSFANDLLQKILLEYFENIDKQTLTTICCDLVLKYTENKNVEKIKNAKRLFILYQRTSRKKVSGKFLLWSSKLYIIYI